jgi:hypothetical protein
MGEDWGGGAQRRSKSAAKKDTRSPASRFLAQRDASSSFRARNESELRGSRLASRDRSVSPPPNPPPSRGRALRCLALCKFDLHASPRNGRTRLPTGQAPGLKANWNFNRAISAWGQPILRHRGNDALQRSGVIGQIVGHDRTRPQWSRSAALLADQTNG